MSGEERYSRLVEYLTDYIYTVKTIDNKVVETIHGPGCYSVTGYTSEDYQNDPDLWYRMVHKDDKNAVLAQANLAQAGENVLPLEHRIIHRDGSIRWVRNSIVLSRDENGSVRGYDGLINDITNLKLAEESSELKQKQLIQADKMATLGILISGIAHEINNPNNFILLNVQLFSKVWRDIKPILREYYENNGDYALSGMPYSQSIEKIDASLSGILNGAERIQKIIRSLTHFARNDSGNLNQDVDLNHVIENAILITGNLIKNSTSNFRVNYGEDIPVVKGNSQQLEQVIINVINNACHALASRTDKIEISLNHKPKEYIVVLTVEDEGKGIEKSKLKHIFDPFFTTKREAGGTGLGLSISYNIVKNHGGDLRIDSEYGEGTKVDLVLPVNKNYKLGS